VTCASLVLALAGCGGGGGGGDPTAAIEQAVKTSPLSYYHYAAAAWWGRPVSVHMTLVHTSSQQATATVSVRAGGKSIATQTVLLVRSGENWTISGSEVSSTQEETNFGTVSGPVSTRPPTAAEHTAVVARALRSFPGEGDCLRFEVAISRVDPAWASAVIRFVGPNRIRCATTGTPLLHRGAGGWRMVAVANGQLPCTKAPPGVVRSLFGDCRIGGQSP
jgi:hypothetical protein